MDHQGRTNAQASIRKEGDAVWFAEPPGSSFATAKMIHEKDTKFLEKLRAVP